MKTYRFYFITILICLLTLSLEAQTASTFFLQHKDYLDKIIIALIGAFIGFLFNYLLAKRKERQELKQLSYNLKVSNVIIKADKELSDNIKLKFKGNDYKSMSLISCQIQNTGKKVVKNEMVRFEFDKKTSILDEFFSPNPEPELNVSSLAEIGRAHV